MILANGINLPLVLLLGLVTIGPLTLFVAAVESLAFRGLYRSRLRVTFGLVLVANILSTVAGLMVYAFQDLVLHEMGIRSAADFAHHYLNGALVLIGLYLLVSVLVEGLYLARRKVAERLGLGRGDLWKGIAAANVLSYTFMGPIFYFSTRPTFHGLEFVDSPAAVTDCTDAIYFIGSEDRHLFRIRPDGTGREEVVPHEVRAFVVSQDQTAFVYRGPGNDLWFFRQGDARPRRIWKTDERFHTSEFDLSADASRVAFASTSEVFVYDLSVGRIVGRSGLTGDGWGGGSSHSVDLLAWDGDDPDVLHCYRSGGWQSWRVSEDSVAATAAPVRRLVGNYRRCMPGSSWGGRHDWGVPLPSAQDHGELSLFSVPGLGKSVRVYRNGMPVIVFHNDYGLLNMGSPGPSEACFLSEPGMVLCGGSDRLYVLDALKKRVAELAQGDEFVAAIPEFQASAWFDGEGKRKR